jgi:hypothetical protein
MRTGLRPWDRSLDFEAWELRNGPSPAPNDDPVILRTRTSGAPIAQQCDWGKRGEGSAFAFVFAFVFPFVFVFAFAFADN